MQSDPAEIARRLSRRARCLIQSWDHDPDAFVDAWDEIEAEGLNDGDGTGRLPELSPLGLLVRAELERMEAKDG